MKPLQIRGTPWPAAIAALVALLLGCTGGDAGSDETGRKFAVTYQTLNNPFFKDLNDGLLSVIEERGDELDVFDASFDAQKQWTQMNDMLLAGYAGIFLNPVNWKGVGRALEEAREEGVPVVVVDAPVQDKDLVVTTVASDNYQAGVLAGEALRKARPNGAKIIALALSVNKACRDRIQGFRDAIAGDDRYVIDTQQELEGGTAEAARPKMQDLLLRTPDVDAVFAINDPAAFGALRALDKAGMTEDVVVIAVDGSDQAVDEIRKGRLLGSSAQFPYEIGRRAALAMYDHLEGKEVPDEIKIAVEFVDTSNADEFEKKVAAQRAGMKQEAKAGAYPGQGGATGSP